MTQTIGIEAFGGHDPAVEIWAAAFNGAGLREAFSGLLDIASEKAQKVIKGTGQAALDILIDPAA